jgi:hypothetical protein
MIRQLRVDSVNLLLLYLLASEIGLGIVFFLFAVPVNLIAGHSGADVLMRIVGFLVPALYLLNAIGALVSLLLLSKADPSDVTPQNLMGHLFNWIYVVGLSWIAGFLVLSGFVMRSGGYD